MYQNTSGHDTAHICRHAWHYKGLIVVVNICAVSIWSVIFTEWNGKRCDSVDSLKRNKRYMVNDYWQWKIVWLINLNELVHEKQLYANWTTLVMLRFLSLKEPVYRRNMLPIRLCYQYICLRVSLRPKYTSLVREGQRIVRVMRISSSE